MQHGSVQDDEQVRGTLATLRLAGISIALADFGIGYSSLRHLDRWPVDAIKIDRPFVDGIEGEYARAVIVDALLGPARDLRIQTIAEGGELGKQADHLRNRGCDQAQGFLFGRALPACVAGELLSRMEPLPGEVRCAA